jgi:hypothetical protein
MAVGDRLIQPVSPTTGAAYAPYEVVNETGDSSGFKQAAMLVKTVDDSGNTLGGSAAASGASVVSSTALEASHVLKASAGTLVSLVGYNSKVSAQFIQLHNSATVPADTAVPAYVFTVPAASNFSLDVPGGIPFTTGISVCNSSTAPTKTVGAADCWFSAVIK